MNLTITWHLGLFIVALFILLYKLLKVDTSGDYNFGGAFETVMYLFFILLLVVAYGGINWW